MKGVKMKTIVVSHTNQITFENQLQKAINKIYELHKNVEIQYRPMIANEGYIVYSALVIEKN